MQRSKRYGSNSPAPTSTRTPTSTMDDHREPVILNIYDLCSSNRYTCYTSIIGLGVFHSGVEIYGTEYSYGGHQDVHSGIYEIEPRDYERLGEHVKYKQSIEMGHTSFTRAEVQQAVSHLGSEFLGISYHLTKKNCNHFASELTQFLCGKKIPPWVNRLANFSNHVPFVRRFFLTPAEMEGRIASPSPSNVSASSSGNNNTGTSTSKSKKQKKDRRNCSTSTQTSEGVLVLTEDEFGGERARGHGAALTSNPSQATCTPFPPWPVAIVSLSPRQN